MAEHTSGMDNKPKCPIPLTQLLAKLGGGSYSYLHKVMSGTRTPSITYAKAIAAACRGKIKWTDFYKDTK